MGCLGESGNCCSHGWRLADTVLLLWMGKRLSARSAVCTMASGFTSPISGLKSPTANKDTVLPWTAGYEAAPFYQKQGYTIFCEFEDYYPTGHSRIGLRKHLSIADSSAAIDKLDIRQRQGGSVHP